MRKAHEKLDFRSGEHEKLEKKLAIFVIFTLFFAKNLTVKILSLACIDYTGILEFF